MISNFDYLKEIKNIFENGPELNEVNFIMGNDSCDLDSALSSYLLSIGKNIKENIIEIKDSIPSINKTSKKVFLPVLNCKRGSINFKLEIKFVFEKFNIDPEDFFYISDNIFNQEKLFEYTNKNTSEIKTNLILVDHTILIENQKYLSPYVIEIYDHHLCKQFISEYKNLQFINIKYPVASCTTLILIDYFLKDFPDWIVSPILALTALLVDSKKFDKDYYNNRWVDIDQLVYEKIKSLIKEEIKMKEYYKQINEQKKDVEKNLELGLENLFNSDQKHIKWNKNQVLWSSLHIPFQTIREKFGEEEILKCLYSFYEKKNKEEIEKMFYVFGSNFLDDKGKFKSYTIFNPVSLPIKSEELKSHLEQKMGKDFYSIESKNMINEKINLKGVAYSIKVDETISRKVLEPIFGSIFDK